MITPIAFNIGRVILALYWLHVAYGHIFKNAGTVGYAQHMGVKSPKLAVVGTGILALIGGASLLSGVWTKYGILALVIFLLGVSFKVHAYWKATDPQAKMMDKIQFGKNMAMLASLLMLLGVSSGLWSWMM